MEYLGTEIGEFCSLIKGNLPQNLCVFNKTRVVIVEAVNIGPYLYLGGINGSSYQRSGEIASSAFQVVGLTESITAYEALGNYYLLIGI